jgi:hypothetical protein
LYCIGWLLAIWFDLQWCLSIFRRVFSDKSDREPLIPSEKKEREDAKREQDAKERYARVVEKRRLEDIKAVERARHAAEAARKKEDDEARRRQYENMQNRAREREEKERNQFEAARQRCEREKLERAAAEALNAASRRERLRVASDEACMQLRLARARVNNDLAKKDLAGQHNRATNPFR